MILDDSLGRVLVSRKVGPIEPLGDPNPRGGRRGGRGVITTEQEIVLAVFDGLLRFDHQLALQSAIVLPLMEGNHELSMDGPSTVWVASTATDMAIRVDLATGESLEELSPRKSDGLVSDLRPDGPLPEGEDFDSAGSLHLNALARIMGQPVALLNGPGAIIGLDPPRVLLRDKCLSGAHNLVCDGNEVFVTDTSQQRILVFELPNWGLARSLPITTLPWVKDLVRSLSRASSRRLSDKMASLLFCRGLVVDGDRLVAGISPASVLVLDKLTGDLLEAYQHSDDIRVAVHGLTVRP